MRNRLRVCLALAAVLGAAACVRTPPPHTGLQEQVRSDPRAMAALERFRGTWTGEVHQPGMDTVWRTTLTIGRDRVHQREEASGKAAVCEYAISVGYVSPDVLTAAGYLVGAAGEGFLVRCLPRQDFRLNLAGGRGGELHEELEARGGSIARGVLRRAGAAEPR